jgi:hypothetical protein
MSSWFQRSRCEDSDTPKAYGDVVSAHLNIDVTLVIMCELKSHDIDRKFKTFSRRESQASIEGSPICEVIF